MDFQTAVKTCFQKYATFSGRARRAEYWWFALFNLIASLVLGFIDGALFGGQVLGTIYSLAILIPSIAVGARRLHDIGRSGWWLLIGLIPLIGALVLLWWFIQPSQEGSNQFGPDPLAGERGRTA